MVEGGGAERVRKFALWLQPGCETFIARKHLHANAIASPSPLSRQGQRVASPRCLLPRVAPSSTRFPSLQISPLPLPATYPSSSVAQPSSRRPFSPRRRVAPFRVSLFCPLCGRHCGDEGRGNARRWERMREKAAEKRITAEPAAYRSQLRCHFPYICSPIRAVQRRINRFWGAREIRPRYSREIVSIYFPVRRSRR